MKTMVVWTAKPGALRDAVSRFLAGQANSPSGVTVLGRWHSVDLSTGFTLYEFSDAAQLYQASAPWADILDLRSYLVVEDTEAGPILAKTFQA